MSPERFDLTGHLLHLLRHRPSQLLRVAPALGPRPFQQPGEGRPLSGPAPRPLADPLDGREAIDLGVGLGLFYGAYKLSVNGVRLAAAPPQPVPHRLPAQAAVGAGRLDVETPLKRSDKE